MSLCLEHFAVLWLCQSTYSPRQSYPEALLELEKENLRKLIGRFNEGLISHAALSERLMTQVVRLIGSSTFEMESKQILPWDVPMSRVVFGKPQSHR